jgi:hypothetical protein
MVRTTPADPSGDPAPFYFKGFRPDNFNAVSVLPALPEGEETGPAAGPETAHF